jgi:hypothetical protein
MFNLSENADQVVYSVVVMASIAAIAIMLIRAFRRKNEKSWPAIFVGFYNILLLLLYLLGTMTLKTLEGLGFVPLVVFTLPWSLCMGILVPLIDYCLGSGAKFRFPGNNLEATLLIQLAFFNILCGSANSYILYFLLKRRQRKATENGGWEQARRNR